MPADWQSYIRESQKQHQTSQSYQQTSQSPKLIYQTLEPLLEKQQQILQKQQEQPSQKQQFRKPTWRPNTYDPFGNFPYYRMDVEQERKEEESHISDRKSNYFPIFWPIHNWYKQHQL